MVKVPYQATYDWVDNSLNEGKKGTPYSVLEGKEGKVM